MEVFGYTLTRKSEGWPSDRSAGQPSNSQPGLEAKSYESP
jgi:hypothetical protein